MSAPEIVWEDPSPAANGHGPGGVGVWQAFVAELRKHPGKWAVAYPDAEYGAKCSPLGSRLRKLGCEATQRKRADGTYTLYARWPEDAA
jgi:hypothetical protein